MGYLPVVLLVQNATHGLMVQNNIYTGPLFIDTPEKAKAVQTLSKEGTRSAGDVGPGAAMPPPAALPWNHRMTKDPSAEGTGRPRPESCASR